MDNNITIKDFLNIFHNVWETGIPTGRDRYEKGGIDVFLDSDGYEMVVTNRATREQWRYVPTKENIIQCIKY